MAQSAVLRTRSIDKAVQCALDAARPPYTHNRHMPRCFNQLIFINLNLFMDHTLSNWK